SGMIAAFELMTGNPVPIRAVQRNQPGLLTQFDCNENRATMVGGGRVYGRYLHLTLRWFECGNPNLPERARSPPHRIYGYVIASAAKQSISPRKETGLRRRQRSSQTAKAYRAFPARLSRN